MKTIYKLFFLTVLICCLQLNAQQWQWAHKLGSNNSNTKISAIKPYPNNQLLVSGTYASVNLNLSGLNLQNSGQDDAFFAICDQAGNYNWAVNVGGNAKDYASAIAADANGNIYLAGNFNSLSILVNGNILTNSGNTDAFLIKYNPDKSFGWIRKFGSLQNDEITALSLDNDGNIYVSLNTPDYINLYKISSNNTVLWQKNISISNQAAKPGSLVSDGSQHIYLTGGFAGKISFNGTDTLYSSKEYNWISGNYDPISNAFIAKFSQSGVFLQAISDSDYYKINQAIFNANSIFTCGERINTFQIIAGPTYPQAESEIFIGKYSSNLNKIWMKIPQNADPWMKTLDVPLTIANDDNSNIYVAGLMHANNLLFNNDTIRNIQKGFFYYSQAFMFKYSQNGDELWYKTLGGKLNDIATGIAIISENQFYIAGNFESDSMLIGNNLLINNSNPDSFIVHAATPVYFRKTMAFLSRFSDNSSTIIDKKTNETLFYPNPFQNIINLTDEYEYELRDLQSRLLQKGKSDIITTKNLPNGIYILTINKSNTYRIIKN